MKKYPIEPERIMLAGLEGARKLRRKICSSRKYEYAWMRVEPCMEMPDPNIEVPRLTCSKDVSVFLHNTVPFAGRGVEYFMVICADIKNVPLAVAVPHRGGRSSAAVDSVVVFQAVLLAGSSGFIIAHNHPSQDPTPSSEDIALTTRLKEGSKFIGVSFLDHIILTDKPERYFSFRDGGILS